MIHAGLRIEETTALRVEDLSSSHAEEGGEGRRTARATRSFLVPINAKLKRSSRGHYLLNHHDRFHIDLGPNAEHGDPPGYDWQSERAADQFAANLLMPSTLVHEAYAEDDSTAPLAHRFKVSESAMGYRLIEFGLR